jgi:hypothetical protein
MFTRIVLSMALLCGFAGPAAAETWNAAQQEVWNLEQQQWKMDSAKDTSWMDTMVHDNLRYWSTGDAVPRDKSSLKLWTRYNEQSSTTLVHELFPHSITITGNVAVVQYHYMVARENDKKERETATGQYTDVLIKEDGKWKFIAWAGGDLPKKH